MPVQLKKLTNHKAVKDVKTISIPMDEDNPDGDSLNVSYRMGTLSRADLRALEKPDLDTVIDFLVTVVQEWDLLDEDNQVIPLDRPSLEKVDLDAVSFVALKIFDAVTPPKPTSTP